MKKTLTVLCLAILVGCGFDTSTKDESGNRIDFGLQIKKVRGCDYVILRDRSNGSVSIFHAGDCLNPIHKIRPSENQ